MRLPAASAAPPPELDIVIPVYNEGDNILPVLASLRRHVRTRFRVLLCYDNDDDDTLAVVRGYYPREGPTVALVKNEGRGALGAVVTGFKYSTAPAVLVLPADDDYNAPRLDAMMRHFQAGCDVVVACRFMPGGALVGCPFVKRILLRSAAVLLHRLVGLPTRDPTNGFRLFSRRVLERIPIETRAGFAYSLELLAKCHRLRWRVGEVPVHWFERKVGQSRFRPFQWAPEYLAWVGYALATQFLGKGRRSMQLRSATTAPAASHAA